MKKFLFSICLFLLFVRGYSQQQGSPTLEKFLADFTSAVVIHDNKAVMGFMDKAYLKIQYDKKADPEGNRFLDEFFSGYENYKNYSGYTNIKFVEISIITVFETTATSDEKYVVIFRIISSADKTIYCRATLHIQGKKMRFSGAVG